MVHNTAILGNIWCTKTLIDVHNTAKLGNKWCTKTLIEVHNNAKLGNIRCTKTLIEVHNTAKLGNIGCTKTLIEVHNTAKLVKKWFTKTFVKLEMEMGQICDVKRSWALSLCLLISGLYHLLPLDVSAHFFNSHLVMPNVSDEVKQNFFLAQTK